MIPEIIFINPCLECIVQVCCSQRCDNKKEYDKYQGVFQRAATMWTPEILKNYEKTLIVNRSKLYFFYN